MSPKSKEGVKKLGLILATSTPVTGTRKEAVENAKVGKTAEAIETAGAGKNVEESKDGYLNLVQVLCI